MSKMAEMAELSGEVFPFLDALRESGKINMFGAAPARNFPRGNVLSGNFNIRWSGQ